MIYRIFYYMNIAGNGHLTLRELKHGNLIAAMQQADDEEDINKVLRYLWFFSQFNCIPYFVMIFQYRLFLGLGPNWTAIIMSYRYFSYEHFYVIYCRFWELDTDHDFFIGKENLIKYGNHSLTYRIVDRIFCQVYCVHTFSKKNSFVPI